MKLDIKVTDNIMGHYPRKFNKYLIKKKVGYPPLYWYNTVI